MHLLSRLLLKAFFFSKTPLERALDAACISTFNQKFLKAGLV